MGEKRWTHHRPVLQSQSPFHHLLNLHLIRLNQNRRNLTRSGMQIDCWSLSLVSASCHPRGCVDTTSCD